MADLKILTAAAPAASLSYGRLAVSAGNLYFGDAANAPVRVSNHGHTHIRTDITDLATYYSQVGHGHTVANISDIADNYSPKFKGITVVSASRSLAATDVNCILHVSGGYTLTIPAGTFTAGSEITIVRTGSSTVTITAGSGAYLNGASGGSVTIGTQYKSVVLRCYSNTVFYAEPVDAAYEPVISSGTTAQYWRGDKTWQTMPTSLPASDVYAWAKASTKPSYSASEIGGLGASYRWLTDTYISTWNAKQDALSAGFGDSINPYASKTAKYFLAAPNASAGSPTFRAIVASDIPTLNQNTTGSAATLTTARTLTIGTTGKTFNGSANVSWSLDEIGATPKRATMTSVGASRNLATSDVNSVLYVTGAYTLTIPSGTFSAGDQITIIRTGASTVTITPGSGVTINGSTSSLTITTKYRAITLIFQASGTVYAIGV